MEKLHFVSNKQKCHFHDRSRYSKSKSYHGSNEYKSSAKGDTPRLIDEWQIAPRLWDAVRNEVDKRDEDGQFMLTGSAVPLTKMRYFIPEQEE